LSENEMMMLDDETGIPRHILLENGCDKNKLLGQISSCQNKKYIFTFFNRKFPVDLVPNMEKSTFSLTTPNPLPKFWSND